MFWYCVCWYCDVLVLCMLVGGIGQSRKPCYFPLQPHHGLSLTIFQFRHNHPHYNLVTISSKMLVQASVATLWSRVLVPPMNLHVTQLEYSQWWKEDAVCVCATIHSQLGVFTIQTCCCYTCIVGHKIHTGLKTGTFQGFHYKSTEMFRDRKIQRFLPRTPSCALTFTHLTNSEHNCAGSAQLKNQSAAVFAFS